MDENLEYKGKKVKAEINPRCDTKCGIEMPDANRLVVLQIAEALEADYSPASVPQLTHWPPQTRAARNSVTDPQQQHQ
jgi:hypothetical protein